MSWAKSLRVKFEKGEYIRWVHFTLQQLDWYVLDLIIDCWMRMEFKRCWFWWTFHRGKTQWEKLPDVDELARCRKIEIVSQLAIDWAFRIDVLMKTSKEIFRLDLRTNFCARNISRGACVYCNLWSATGMRLFLTWWHSIWKIRCSLNWMDILCLETFVHIFISLQFSCTEKRRLDDVSSLGNRHSWELVRDWSWDERGYRIGLCSSPS